MATSQRQWLGWMTIFDAVLIAPLAVAPFAAATQRANVLVNLSVFTGLIATSLMVVTIALLSRVKAVSRRIGIELSKAVHIRMGIATAVMTLVHLLFATAASPHGFHQLDPIAGGPPVQMGVVAAALVFAISIRVRPRSGEPNYARRARWHAAGAVAMFAAVAAHILLVGRLVSDPASAVVLAAMALGLITVLAVRWVVRPLGDRGAHVVQHVREENAATVTLVLAPIHLRRPLRLEPGQFVWLRLGRQVLTTVEHPFTVAHAARNGRIELTIRVCGRFTHQLAALEPGTRIWLDGPYGSFVPGLCGEDPAAADGVVFIAGGVGITPIQASLRALAEAQDQRPHHLLLAERPGEALFGTELDRHLRHRLRLRVERTQGRPIDPALLADTLPPDAPARLYYVSGGPRMVQAAVGALTTCGVPRSRIATEQF